MHSYATTTQISPRLLVRYILVYNLTTTTKWIPSLCYTFWRKHEKSANRDKKWEWKKKWEKNKKRRIKHHFEPRLNATPDKRAGCMNKIQTSANATSSCLPEQIVFRGLGDPALKSGVLFGYPTWLFPVFFKFNWLSKFLVFVRWNPRLNQCIRGYLFYRDRWEIPRDCGPVITSFPLLSLSLYVFCLFLELTAFIQTLS